MKPQAIEEQIAAIEEEVRHLKERVTTLNRAKKNLEKGLTSLFPDWVKTGTERPPVNAPLYIKD